jgi:hypothetical protein
LHTSTFPENFRGTTPLGNVPEIQGFSVFIKNRNVMCHFNSARDVNSKNLVGFPEIPEFGKKGKPSEKKKTAQISGKIPGISSEIPEKFVAFSVFHRNRSAARYTWLKLS